MHYLSRTQEIFSKGNIILYTMNIIWNPRKLQILKPLSSTIIYEINYIGKWFYV